MPILVAADADRVQDLIFRSSRLREVVGGSHALEAFWSRAAALAQERGGRVVVSAGGTFRVVFEDTDAANAFGRDLLDIYAVQIGGGLTVVHAEAGDERALLDEAGGTLAAEKLRGDPPAASIHFPYLQPCQSCARDLALHRVPVGAGETQDLCAVCAERRGLRDHFQESFLARMKALSLPGLEGDRARVAGLSQLPEDADEVGSYDSRGRVAYLLADGNGFGQLFGRAAAASARLDDEGSVYRNLSRTVGEAGSHALAVATARLVAALPPAGLRDGSSPVLPLITGGDDVFALLPAPWAVRFAEWFAEALVARVGAASVFAEAALPPPTVSCALVFCKATFPYRFAHGVGERSLKKAKTASRTRAGESLLRMAELRSMVAEKPGPSGEHGDFRIGAASAGTLSTGDLLAARGALGDLPGKRRHQIEGLYGARDDESPGWVDRRTRLLERAGSVRAGGVDSLLAALEQEEGGSAVPDLLHFWDYLRMPEEGTP